MIVEVGLARSAAVIGVVAFRCHDPVVPAESAKAHVVRLSAAAAVSGGVAVERSAAARRACGNTEPEERPGRRGPAEPQPHAPRTPAAIH